jgi:hypothetical protein
MLKVYFLIFFLIFSGNSFANLSDWTFERKGSISAKLSSYQEKSIPNYGQKTNFEIEQTTNFSDKAILINQLRFKTNSLATDISKKTILEKNDSYETALGENYFKYLGNGWIGQVGYQEIAWGESFGFNYSDIINPKDFKETMFSDISEARLPLLIFNGKKLFSNQGFSGSFQIIYSPEPRFSKTLPLDLFIGNLFTQSQFNIIKEKSPKIGEKSDMGLKVSTSYRGYDTSLFLLNYIDRNPTYSLISLTSNSLTLKESHKRIQSMGFSFAKTIFDFVLRSDIVLTQKQTINYISSQTLKAYEANKTSFVISFDSPTYQNISGSVLFAQSKLDRYFPMSFNQENETYSILKLVRNLNNDKTLELAYIHEFKTIGHSIQSFLAWPVTSNTDIKLGLEAYWGNSESNLVKYKNINSVFFSLKNYFSI